MTFQYMLETQKNGNSSRVQFINDLVKCVKKTRSYFFYSLNAGFWRPLSKNWLAIYDMRKNPHFCQYISENLLTKKLKKKKNYSGKLK